MIGAWLLSSPQQREWQPKAAVNLTKTSKTVAFRWNPPCTKRSFFRNLEINIMLRLTIIFWISWISFGNLTAFIKPVNVVTGFISVRFYICETENNPFFLNQVFGICIWIHLSVFIMFPLFTDFLHLSLSSCFPASIVLPMCTSFGEYTVNHWWDNKFVTVSVVCSFWFSVTPFLPSFCFLPTLVSSSEAQIKCLFAVFTALDSASVRLLLFFLNTPSVLPSSFSFLNRDERICCLFPCSSYGCLSPCLFFLPVLFQSVVCCLCSLPRSFSFSVLKMKRSLLSAVCCLHSESFSSGSLPHAGSLTVWVKRTDPPRIANVLRGNQLNYAHCGGEDIHNTGIKLLKVTQYLALHLPAVYRRWSTFGKLTCTCPAPALAMRLTEGRHCGCWPTLASSGLWKDARWRFVGRHPANQTTQTWKVFYFERWPVSSHIQTY